MLMRSSRTHDADANPGRGACCAAWMTPKAVSVNLFRWYWRIPIVLMARRRARQDDARAAWIASLTAHNQLGWGCCPHQVCPECEDDDRW